MNYIKIGTNQYLVKKFESFGDMMSFASSKEDKESVWKDFPKVEWDVRFLLAKLILIAKKRNIMTTNKNKKEYERKKIYNIH